jgi:flagellar motility protein MotE (MotC chaperone)
MIRFPRTVRLLPIVIIAAVSLFALKVSGLLFDGGYTLGERLAERGKPQLTITSADSVPAYPKIVMADGKTQPTMASKTSPKDSRLSWAEQMFNYGNANPDITGSVPESKPEDKGPNLKVSDKPPAPTKLEPSADPMMMGAGRIASPGERAILERLQQRRKQLDKRTRDLDMRESLLKAAEKRVEARVNELKELEKKVNAATGHRDKSQKQQFESLVAMYEAMRPKDAARIFDRLDISILVEVATGMKARSMSAILAQMTPEAAERLTVELANRASANDGAKTASPDQLPKIGGNTAQR